MEKCITTSVFDLFKVGPGPSSSHTIGPMKAAGDFLKKAAALKPEQLQKAEHVEVDLYGSLSSTGKGHGTNRAVAAGLLGQVPEHCDIELLNELLTDSSEIYKFSILGVDWITFSASDIHFQEGVHNFPFQNTLVIRLKGSSGIILEQTYYSIGGGFIKCEGEAEKEKKVPPYRYRDMNGLKNIVAKYDLPLWQILLENEKVESKLSEEEIFERLDFLIEQMEQAVTRGISTEGVLPGPIKLQRKAKAFYEHARKFNHGPDQFLAMLNSFSLGASEENAAGHMVVTAPTSGSAGVLPGIIHFLKNYQHVSSDKLRKGMLIAAVIGFIARNNASISGAEVGCQGEIGVAAAMAAALLAFVNDCNVARIECAAEIALEHHLGMTCDPVGGYVQIPCIERNAVGAVTAYNAYLLAALGDPDKQKVSFDEVIEAMLETGREMSSDLKETSRGGLAICSLCC
jgi:L-serine dehydratase